MMVTISKTNGCSENSKGQKISVLLLLSKYRVTERYRRGNMHTRLLTPGHMHVPQEGDICTMKLMRSLRKKESLILRLKDQVEFSN